MASRNRRAGGIFIVAGILLGILWGLSSGDPMKGIVIGTCAGIALAVAVWLVDRRR